LGRVVLEVLALLLGNGFNRESAMTYFFALVLLPPEASKYHPEKMFDEIDHLIMPADQSFPDQPYLIPCQCIGYEAQQYGIEDANRQVGSFCRMARSYLSLPESSRPVWREYSLVTQWQAFAEQAAKSHLNYTQPKSQCDYCKGSGKMEVTGNHSSFVGYDYWANQDVSELHLGSSMVSWARDLPEQLDVDALVTPDGEWHEIDLWNQPQEEWREQVLQHLHNYSDHLAVKLYMHS
jgi:hypothetical protein